MSDEVKKEPAAEAVPAAGSPAEKTPKKASSPARKKPQGPPPIELLYRQVFDMIEGKVVGFEAQMRLNDRDLGTMLPSLFVPIAERSNRIVELTRWAFLEVSEMLARQRGKGRTIDRVFIPVSVKYLCKSYFLIDVKRRLDKAAMQPSEICIMLDAASLAQRPDGLSEAVAAVHEAGIKVAVTGVGEDGFSMLQLGELAPDYLQLDAAFVERLMNDERTKDIAGSFSELATKLGTELIADGVQTKEQAAALQAIGCSLMQGPYISEFERERRMF